MLSKFSKKKSVDVVDVKDSENQKSTIAKMPAPTSPIDSPVDEMDNREESHEEKIERILKSSFIKKYLEDDGVTDINFDGVSLRIQHNQTGARIEEERPSQDEVRRLTKQIADVQRKTLTDSQPILDTEFGYIRVNAIHEAASPDGRAFSLRISRPRLAVDSISQLFYGNNKITEQLLIALMQAEQNVIIAGRTGSGKTEAQKMLVGPIQEDKVIFLIEDTRDSHIKKLYPEKFIYSTQTLLSDERAKKVTMSDLVKAALRSNPDWVIISETRGIEAADILDSVKTDHSIITTIHAKGAKNIPSRLVPMIRQAPAYAIMSDQTVGREIVEFLRFGIYMQAERINGKISRKIKEIVEYTDFDEKKGANGVFLYRHEYNYNEQTGEYEESEVYNPISEETLQVFKNKRLLHLLPDVFNPAKQEKVSV